EVTFTFSEAVDGFDAGDVSVGNGTLSDLTQVDDHTWTATVTPDATGDVTVSVAAGSYTDLAGNAGSAGSDSDVFDRTAPTVDVAITDNGQDGTLVLTFAPDTDTTTFDPSADLDLVNADLGTDGTWDVDGAGNQVWTATITPTANGEVTATVTDGSYTDTAGNEGSEGVGSEDFDVSGPSVNVDIVNNGQTGEVTFTFSEAVDGFDASDVSVGNGTLSDLTQVDDHTWTATVTPENAGGEVSVTVADDSYTDIAGNLGEGGTDAEIFDRYEPLAQDDHSNLTIGGDDFSSDRDFNVAFVLDFSGSVSDDEADQMLQAVKAAGQTFFEGTTGDVQIQLIAFASDASSTMSFTNYNDFAAQVDAWENNRPMRGGTDYTEAVNQTKEDFQPIDGYDNRVFFMSDGEPTEQTSGSWGHIDHSLLSNTEAAWNDFVANNDIEVQTVGIGQGVSVPRLQDVDEADGDNHVIEVSNFDALVDELIDSLKGAEVSGNVLRGDDDIAGTADDDLLGVDGGHILSIAVDGETYTYGTDGVVDSQGNTVSDDATFTVDTAQGGSLTFDFESGDWVYEADSETTTGTEAFDYVLTDDSGDTSSATLTVDVQSATAGASATASMALEADSADAVDADPVFATAASDLHVQTLGLGGAYDDADAGDENTVSVLGEDNDLTADDLVYEDNVESLEAYLPEENNTGTAAGASEPADAGTVNVDLDEIEDHAAMVG
ncbi:Ig-like domain-containing protein, partial [Martelella mangrovi]